MSHGFFFCFVGNPLNCHDLNPQLDSLFILFLLKDPPESVSIYGFRIKYIEKSSRLAGAAIKHKTDFNGEDMSRWAYSNNGSGLKK